MNQPDPARERAENLIFLLLGIAVPLGLTQLGVDGWTVVAVAGVGLALAICYRVKLTAITAGALVLASLIGLCWALIAQSPSYQIKYQLCDEPEWVPVHDGYALGGVTVGVRIINEGERIWVSDPLSSLTFDSIPSEPGVRSEPQPLDAKGDTALVSRTVELPQPKGGNGPSYGSYRFEIPYGRTKETADSDVLVVSGQFVVSLTQARKRAAFSYDRDPGSDPRFVTKPCRPSDIERK